MLAALARAQDLLAERWGARWGLEPVPWWRSPGKHLDQVKDPFVHILALGVPAAIPSDMGKEIQTSYFREGVLNYVQETQALPYGLFHGCVKLINKDAQCKEDADMICRTSNTA